MNNTKTKKNNQIKTRITPEISLLLKGLIIGKVMTIVVLGGLFWWLLKMRWIGVDANSSSSYSAAAAKFSYESVTDVPIGSFKYGGSPAWASIRQLVDSQIQSARPELQLHYVAPSQGSPSSSLGIRMLIDGQLDFAQSSRPLTDEEYAIAKQRGFTLEQRQVGVDGIAVIVNPSLNVSGLTVSQLQEIYQGRITNWKQVGGPNLPITPFSQHLDDADIAIFPENQTKRQKLSQNVHYVNSTTEAIREVSKTNGGIYYAPASTVVLQCTVKPLSLGRTTSELIPPYRQPLVLPQQCPTQRNQVNTEAIKNGSYPITTNLFVIIKHNNNREEQAGEAYTRLLLTDEGQKAISRLGF
ncbi:substrate-binding domain-containing protein [Aetokthonos hydrillicola Thurmond2011]|uniref:Substrate-binding domain-containing protein n=1 Tax=Aetokthonos hydrillicola Thurmond2011 TaxID=2712845 RepID=A0AAP5M950_9CYAN|nr:substrate-binding domain-containing protein [Aetokthonos hydrillicola]MBO3457335.1 phosphate ABC transporter substrate-binding protein [Aetokthonos hydrillicola CCALA 1050]MBW4586684.1 substrate-binding domain-containing protein [Aetokthonos hydrillicola CCALA 1050]MDR9893989.1 substrate-binding domain-containing protein [Aetokthonos hydrillicola Thurmond2011]